MIKKSLLIAFLFLIFHLGIVWLYPYINNSQHQWQDNIIKTQKFIYDTKSDTVQNVIIGSSLSCRLVMDSLNGFFNLSFAGLSIFDGLNILCHKNNLPKNIYIEMNVVLRDEDNEFTSSVFSPFLYDIRKYIPSFREEFQPVGQFYKIFLTPSKKKNTSIINNSINNNNSERNDLLKKMIQNEKQEYSIKPDNILMETTFKKLKEYVSFFEKKKVQIVFYEMPFNKKLYDLPRARSIREYFFLTFPPNKYHYIYSPDCKDYLTSDGLHLPPDEALRYTCYFKGQINQISKKNN